MSWRRRVRPDHGYATAELAAALPTLMLVVAVALGAVGAAVDRTRCVDAARDAALAAARGADGGGAGSWRAPPGATVRIERHGDTVTAVVSMPVRSFGLALGGLEISESATAEVEPGAPA
jgi:hypothetical protein